MQVDSRTGSQLADRKALLRTLIDSKPASQNLETVLSGVREKCSKKQNGSALNIHLADFGSHSKAP